MKKENKGIAYLFLCSGEKKKKENTGIVYNFICSGEKGKKKTEALLIFSYELIVFFACRFYTTLCLLETI